MNKLPSNTFCILPWIHANFWPNGDVHHCCLGDWREPMGNLSEDVPDNIVNNDNFKKLRLKMLNGEQPSSCSRCFERENNGIVSMRQHHNDRFSESIPEVIDNTHRDGHVDDYKFKYWDFRFSNLCNMKCRMCGSGFSSLWYDDEVQLKQMYNDNTLMPKDRVLNSADVSKTELKKWITEKIDDVEYCYFAGGEPLIMDEHYFILQQLVDANKSNVVIRYNTNLLKLKFKKYDLVDMWSFFKRVQVNASIDDIGNRAEYIRSGTVWDDVQENIIKLKKTNVILNIECTTQLMNVLYIPQLYDRMLQLGIQPQNILLHNILQTPNSYSIKILSDELKSQVTDNFDNYIKKLQRNVSLNTMKKETVDLVRERFDSVVSFMYDIDGHDIPVLQQQFKLKQYRLDTIRNEDFVTVFPELKEWYNGISM